MGEPEAIEFDLTEVVHDVVTVFTNDPAAKQILLTWAGTVSEGMLPNRFPDQGDRPEFNAADASLAPMAKTGPEPGTNPSKCLI